MESRNWSLLLLGEVDICSCNNLKLQETVTSWGQKVAWTQVHVSGFRGERDRRVRCVV